MYNGIDHDRSCEKTARADRIKRRRLTTRCMYVMAILYEVLVPLSTAILIIINEPPGMARLSIRLAYTVTYRNDVMLYIYTL